MALNKHQLREAAQHAADNGLSEAEALAELFPDEVQASRPARRAPKAESAPKE